MFKAIRKNWLSIFIGGLLGAVVLSDLILAAVPPVSRDALTHHLAVPKLYLKYGSMFEIPTVVFSYYPMNLDLLYLIPLYFGNDIIPKYIHFAFALLTAWFIYVFVKDRIGKPLYGLLGVLLFLSLPIIIKLSITVYVDLGLVFFSAASLLYVLKWAAKGYQIRHLLLAGVFCGLGLGTKYNGLISLFLIALFIPVLYLRGNLQPDYAIGGLSIETLRKKNASVVISYRALRAAVVFISVSLVVFSPWMIRNYIWTRNPIYPLYQTVFSSLNQSGKMNTQNDGPIAFRNNEKSDSRINHFILRKKVFDETPLELITIPVRIFFQGKDNNPRYFDGKLNPYLFFFPFLAIIGLRGLPKRQKRENLALFSFSVLFLLYGFFQIDMRIRYIAPIIPPLVILSVIGLHQTVTLIRDKWTGAKRRVGFGLVAVAVISLLMLNAQYIVAQFRWVDPMSYLSGRLGRDDYIKKYRGEYPAIQFINLHLPQTARLLALYLGNRIYYCDREMVCNDDFFKRAIAAATSADSLGDILLSRGFSHLLIRYDYFTYFILNYLNNEKRMLFHRFLETKTKKLFSERVYHVFEILDARPAPTVINSPAEG
ncbi:MAG: glycosyltransferase family 39 protein [Desulfobacterales bacterium]|nr:MAG: glycosyltransferase family 39 protein [Desulfobacterales bacterium]